MTDERLLIVSADGHAGPERMADYAAYLDPAFRDDYNDYLEGIARYDAQFDDGLTGGGAGARAGEDGLWDFALRTRHLDEDGVSAEIIFTQGAAPFGAYPAVAGRAAPMAFEATPAQIVAGCRAYNRWLADRCAHDPRRHHGVARVPLPDVEAAVAEVEHAASLGLRGGVALPPLAPGGIANFNDRRFEPFWAACAANGMAMNMHGGANLSYGEGPERLALILAETDWFSHRGLSHLIFSGVFERHPGLHLAITEQRIHWIDPTLRDFDSIYAFSGNAGLRRILPRAPSEYFVSNCFLGASFMSRPECENRGTLGATSIMWGSDYPHEEGAWPHTPVSLRWTFGCGVPPDELRQMLGLNAVRCYGLDEPVLRGVAREVGPTEAELRAPVEQLPRASETLRESWAFRQEGAWH